MTSRDFAYWLQGYFEIRGGDTHTLAAEQVECIKRHLAMVFAHEIDPSMGGAGHQAKLDELHTPKPPAPGPTHNPGDGHHWPPVMRC